MPWKASTSKSAITCSNLSASERFLKAANRALSIFTLQQQPSITAIQAPPSNPEPGSIYIKSDKKLVQFNLNEIWYLESLGNYVKIWNEQKYILTPRTLTSFEEQLPTEHFLRIHKSFILNKRFVNYIDGNTIRLRNGRELPLGKNYRHVVKQLLQGE